MNYYGDFSRNGRAIISVLFFGGRGEDNHNVVSIQYIKALCLEVGIDYDLVDTAKYGYGHQVWDKESESYRAPKNAVLCIEFTDSELGTIARRYGITEPGIRAWNERRKVPYIEASVMDAIKRIFG